MSGKKSRTKGKNYELEVIKTLRSFFPDASRNLDQYQKNDGRDFANTEPLCIQAKRRKRITMGLIEAALIEAALACDGTYQYPVAVTRSNGGRSIVSMELGHFIELLCGLEDGEI